MQLRILKRNIISFMTCLNLHDTDNVMMMMKNETREKMDSFKTNAIFTRLRSDPTALSG